MRPEHLPACRQCTASACLPACILVVTVSTGGQCRCMHMRVWWRDAP
jgi:hypothetical protein